MSMKATLSRMHRSLWITSIATGILCTFAVPPTLAADEGAPADSDANKPVPGVNQDETLSEQLRKNQGVIDPPPIGDEGIHTTAPEPEPGTTPVIPPPGTPGGDQSVQPK
ncbi:MAG: hypothetical protein ACREDO_12130 [Methyloceanibacter sp.]